MTMFELKPITTKGLPRAVAKAERYRLLNEPQEAESICRDILAIDPDNQEVLVMLLLAITDQFGRSAHVGSDRAQEVLVKLRGDYERAYYSGVISERWGKAQIRTRAHAGMFSGFFQQAMGWYEKAMALAPAGNDDAILRWNACVRFQEQDPSLRSDTEEAAGESSFPDGAPAR
jgi:tetratricopeptide (TPR) repeat protein